MTHDKGEHAPGHKLRVGQEGRFDFSQLDQADISNGIDDGTVTDPAAAHVLVRREWGWARTLYTGGYLKEMEGRYAPLLQGDPQTMVQCCGRRADARMTFDHPVESDATAIPLLRGGMRWQPVRPSG